MEVRIFRFRVRAVFKVTKGLNALPVTDEYFPQVNVGDKSVCDIKVTGGTSRVSHFSAIGPFIRVGDCQAVGFMRVEFTGRFDNGVSFRAACWDRYIGSCFHSLGGWSAEIYRTSSAQRQMIFSVCGSLFHLY